MNSAFPILQSAFAGLRFHGIIDRRHPGAGPVFAPTVHGSAWPNGPHGQTLQITAFQCQAFRCAQALRWNTITSFAAVEHKSPRQHRYGGVGKHGFYRAGQINELRPGGEGLLPTPRSHRPVRALISAYGSSKHGFAVDLWPKDWPRLPSVIK